MSKKATVWFALLLIALAFASDRALAVGALTPRMNTEDFFRALNLADSRLLQVRSAVEENNWDVAVRAFAAYLRGRAEPRWFSTYAGKPGRGGKVDSSVVAKADRVVAHLLESVGIEHQFGAEIDWTYNPTYEPDSPYAHDNEWTWQLNRHWMWQVLAKAYWQTGDEKYAREFAAELVHWIRHCPMPVGGANQRPFSTWRTIEAGLRMAYSWPEAFFAFRRSPSVPDSALVAMVASMLEQARYLKRYPTRGNWLTMEMDGLYTVGALFPEFKEAKSFRDFALGRLAEELDVQVYPDGAQIELSPGYHTVALRNFLRPFRLAKLNDYPVPSGYRKRLERMFDFLMWIMTPNGSVPHLNDAWDVDVRKWLREGVELFPGRDDFLWLATDGTNGHPPAGTSHLLPYAGLAVMRSDWSDTASYVVLDAGPFGFGHQHEDKLSFILTWRGVPFVVEAGSYAYDASEWRKYVLSARGHNVISVDGLEQHRRGHPRDTYVVHEPVPLLWKMNADVAYVEAAYGGGIEVFGDGLRVRHTRRFLYLKGKTRLQDLWLVLDSLEPMDEAEHSYESVFHFDVDTVKLETANRFALAFRKTQTAGLQVAWASAGGIQARIVKGQTRPVVQGWLPLHHGRRGVRPIPTLVLATRRRGRFHLAAVFAPVAADGKPSVRTVKLDNSRGWQNPVVHVVFGDGSSSDFEWQLRTSPGWAPGQWARTRRLHWVRRHDATVIVSEIAFE